jgi:hypothetical protein
MENSIHYVLILDQSGSMGELKREVVSSFNEQIDMIKLLQGKDPNQQFKITLCRFNDTIDFRFIGEPVNRIEKITDKDYQPESFTALYDAIGKSFSIVSEMINPDDQVFFAIFTDGLENASKLFTEKKIKELLRSAEDKNWEVKFFCRYEDEAHYRDNLNLDNKMYSVSMNDNGLRFMAKEVETCLFRLSTNKKEDNDGIQ